MMVKSFSLVVLFAVFCCIALAQTRSVRRSSSSWGSCSKQCGGGIQSRRYTTCRPRCVYRHHLMKGREPVRPMQKHLQRRSLALCPYGFGYSYNSCSTHYQSRTCNTHACYTGCTPGKFVKDNCGQRCFCTLYRTLSQCTRIRKEFTSMTTAERKRYVRVVKTASTHASYKNVYDDLINLHKRLFSGRQIHKKKHFLTWHRWYILKYENLLRRVDCRVTVPYWDWSVVSGNPWGTTPSDLWYSGNSGFGGNGVPSRNCVKTGPFREGVWQLEPSVPAPRCLRRGFNDNPPDSVAIAQLLDYPHTQFHQFDGMLRAFHDNVHCLIDGTMCSTDSSGAPEFFLHHGFVDKIWTDWQKKSNRHKTVYFSSLNAVLPEADGFRSRQLIDNAALPWGVRVKYAEIKNKIVRNSLRRLRKLPRATLRKIPRANFSRISNRALKLFGVSARQAANIRNLEAKFHPKIRRQLSFKGRRKSSIDSKLGFNHRVLKKLSIKTRQNRVNRNL